MATAVIRCVGTAQMPATDDASSSVASATITLPDGLQDNDIFLVVVGVRSATVTPSVTTAGGQTWNSGTQLQANSLTVNYFWTRISGAFTNPVIGWTTANSYVLWSFAFRGVDTTTAIDAAAVLTSQAAALTYTNAASYITTATNGALVLHAMVSADDNTWNAQTSGFDLPKGLTQWRNAVTTGTSMTVGYQIQATAGGSASFAATQATLGSDAGIRFAVALKPATVTAQSNFVAAGHFATGTGTTPVTVSGLAGRPKVVIGIETRQTADGAGAGLMQGFGVMAEGHTRALYAGAVDNVGFGDSVIAMAKNIFMLAFNPFNGTGGDVYGGTNQVGQATIAQTSDGFTFTPSDAFGENGLISYLALGGDDIVQAEAADFVLPIATGSVAYSGLFNFKPDFLIFPNTWSNDTAWNEITNVVDSDECVGTSFGFCDKDLGQAAFIGGANSQASGATTGSSISKTGSAYLEFDYTAEFNGTHALRYDAAVTALAFGGFTLNWTTVSGTTAAANLRTVIGIKLSATGKLRVINGNTPTSAGNLSITTDQSGASLSGTTYAGGMIGCGCDGTAGAARTDELLTVGVFDGTHNESACWWYKEGGGASGSVPTSDRSFRNSSSCFAQRSNNTSMTAVGTATASSLANGLTLNFTAADASAHTVTGFVFGPASASGVTGTFAGTSKRPTLAASGTTTVTGTFAGTSKRPTLASSGTSTVTGTFAGTSKRPTLAASGTPTVTGTMAGTSPRPTLAASGTVGNSGTTGTFAATSPRPSLAAAGTSTVQGTFAGTTKRPSLAASGSPTVSGTFAATTPRPSLNATNITSTPGYYRAHHRKHDKDWHP